MSADPDVGLRLVPDSEGPTVLPGRFRPPVAAASELRRDRLVRRLQEDPAPVTLVCGPAGAGKTSLVATWVSEAAEGGPIVAWLGLDQRDDDPRALWDGIIGALRSTGGFPRGSRLHELSAPRPPVDPGFVDAVLDAVAEVGSPVWLILDDLQVVHDAPTLASIEQLCLRLPSDLHLVVTSRSEPPIGLARLRVQGRLRELRANDLAFTLDETAAFLRGRRLELDESAIEVIQQRTEGWVAGVAIASMALAGAEDPQRFIERFSGDDHAVADYLLTEVLAALPAELLTFLLRTSVCSRLSLDLARELSGRQDAGDVLERLVRDNVFTERIGRGRTVYRYHELLRTFLRAELRRTSPPGTEQELHGRAAGWWADHAEPSHAIEHLIRAGDVGGLGVLVDRHGLAEVLDGRAHSAARSLSLLRGSVVDVPVVALVGAAAAIDVGDLDTADRWLGAIDLPGVIAGPDGPLAALAASVALARARHAQRIDQALATLEATEAGTTGDPDRDLYALYHRGVARAYCGRYEEAIRDLERATAIARATGRDGILVECLSFLGGAHATISHLPEMRRYAELSIDLGHEHGWSRSGALAHAQILLGWSAHLRGEAQEAASHTALGLAALDQHTEPDVELVARSVHLIVSGRSEPDLGSLRSYRSALTRLADAPQPPALLAYVGPPIVRLCLDLGEHEAAKGFAATFSERLRDAGERGLLRAMLLHDAGRHEAARRELAPLVQVRPSCHVLTSEIQLRLLASELEVLRANQTVAHELLVEALQLAEPVSIVVPFLGSEPIRALLTTGRGRFGRLEAFAERVLTAAPSTAGSAPRLTPGELAVLRELPSMLSLREIADARALSLNTVKSHLRSIYRKLGVSGRREAVETARLHRLL
jgi:LuxR family transcriptional regulator, maltose regulon positive regulatory protein